MLCVYSAQGASRVGVAVAGVGALCAVLSAGPVSAQEVGELIVTATRQPERVSSVLADVTVIRREDIDRSGAVTLEDLLSRESGMVFSSNGGPGALSSLFVRGTNSNHVLLLVDGVRVGSATAGTPTWSRVPLAQIERIEVVRGPMSSLYGSDAIGGVVQVFTRRGQDGQHLDAELGVGSRGTVRGSAAWSGAQDRLSYALSLGYERTDGIDVSLPSRTPREPDRDRFALGSTSARVTYRLSRDHEAGVSYLFSRGENDYDGYSPDAANRSTVSNLVAHWRAQWLPSWRSEVRVGRSADDAEERSRGEPTSRAKTTQRLYAWQNDIQTTMGTWLLGAERLEQGIVATSAYDQTRRAIDSLFVGWQWRAGAHTAQVNVRRDDNTQFGAKQTGSLAYGYQLTPAWRASVGYGTAFKVPTFNDLYFPQTCFFGECYGGNADLKPERSRNREAALHYEQGPHKASVVWFLNEVSDLIEWGNTPVNVSQARIEGWSVRYLTRAVGLDWRAQFDHLSPVNRSTGELLAKRAQRQALASVGQSVAGWDWRLEAQARSHRVEYPYAQPTARLGGYAVVNAQVSRRLDRPGWTAFAKVDNVFDRDYELSKGFRTPGVTAFVGVRYSTP